jgi:hemerythrin-like domain-containing protein
MSEARETSPQERREDPLDLIEAEHARLMTMAEHVLELAEKRDIEAVAADADMLLDYLTGELPRHARNEDDDLAFLLRARCAPKDHVEPVLSELSQEHAVDAFLGRHAALDLRVLATGRDLDSPARLFDTLRKLAEDQRRHLLWENEVVLPLARRRLLPEDLEKLSQGMATRRRS